MFNLSSLSSALGSYSVQEIIDQLLTQIKEYPQDLKARETLFKFYCVDGLWDKALAQLKTLELLDEEMKKQIELYRNLVFSEMQRSQVLTGERLPATMSGEMPEWMSKLHQSSSEYSQGQSELADALRSEAFESASESAGKSDVLGEFSWIADGDSRLGPVCEFICAGGYRWLPFSSIQEMKVQEPEDLIDLLWIPSTIKVDDNVYYGFIPARYPVHEMDNDEIKLGSKTEWLFESDPHSPLLGRKVLITNNSEHSIIGVGSIAFE